MEYVATWERDWERKAEERVKTADFAARQSIASVMFERGHSLEDISKCTDLSKKQIKELVQAHRPH